MTESPVKKTKILVVEDEAVICMHIRNSLERLGYEVCGCVASGSEAMQAAAETHPDLILMDIVLQGDMDGIEAAQIIRERFGIPIVYMTGNADIPTITRARGTDPYGYILKPIDVLHMFSTIDTIMHRRDLELRLAENEEMFRAISENILEGIALTVGYKNIWVNDTFADIFGYAKDEMVGHGPELVIHPDELPMLMQRAKKLLEGAPPVPNRVRGVRKDGTELHVEVLSRLVRFKESTAILVIIRDVTASVKIENALMESEEKYRSLVENLNEIIISIDEKGIITFVSHSAEAHSGYTQHEMVGRPFLDFIFPDDAASILGNFMKRRQGLAGATECRAVSKSGNLFWVRVSGTPIMRDGVFRGVRGLLSNIDERKRAEEALRESEEKFRGLVQNLMDVIIIMDSSGVIVFENPATKEMLGYSLMGKTGFDIVHPEDLKTTAAAFSEVINETNRHMPTLFRVRHADGSWLYFEALGSNLMDNKIVPGILLVCRDVTERMKTQVALREREERYRALFDQSPVGVFLFDKDLVITECNDYFAGMMQTPRDMIIGFNSATQRETEVVGKMRETITGNPSSWEGWYHAPNSELSFYHSVNYSPLRDVAGNVVGGIAVVSDLSERKRAEKALQESEERYRALFDQSPLGILHFDRNMIITECNKRLPEIMHSTRQKLIGLDLHLAKGRDAVEKIEQTLAGNVASYEGPYHPITSDTVIMMSMNSSPLRDEGGAVIGGMIVIEDITDRKIAEKQLKLSEERNRLLIEHANEGIVVVQDWRFIFVNPRFIALMGYTAEELAARRFTDYVYPDDREMIAGRYVKRLGGDASLHTYEVRFLDRDGSVRWTEVNSVMLLWEKKTSVLLFIRDISERKRAEEDRVKMDAQIQQTQKLESLGVLAGGIAHDFNNLLMAILGNIDLALMDMTPSLPARGNLLEAAKASQRAADLCRQMLAYSGRGRFTSEAIDLNEIIEDMAHMLEVSISKKAVLRYNFASGIPAIEADVTQVRQIIMNLVINASDAIGQKSGVISISTGVMTCDRSYLADTWLDENQPEGMYVYAEVADTGCGIENGNLPKIFDPFYTTKFTGRGLGLAAVLGIVRGHRGAIKVYSEKGRGTTFKVLFPVADRDAERILSKREAGDDWKGGGTLLLVDDEETIRVLGRRMLEHFGFTVLTAENGREAIDIFSENADGIRCVIMDLTMPHMDGDEAFREIRRIRKDACVIMSSGYNEQEINQRFAGKGIAGFIQKPYQMSELAAKLKEVLG